MRIPRASILLLFALARCSCEDQPGQGGAGDAGGGGGGDGGPPPPACIAGLESITLSPADTTVTLDGVTPPSPIVFTATGMYSGGRTEAIDPSKLAWTGATNGVFTPGANISGTVNIEATDGCVVGRATISFFADAVIGRPQDETPWMATPVPDGAPVIVYPSDQTRFPRNIYRTLFQWRAGDTTEYRLSFEGPHGHVTVYTDGAHALCADAMPRAGCWEADEAAWTLIAGVNAGETTTWTVAGLDRTTMPPTVRSGASITIGFSKTDVPGAIFYWSTTSKGIRRANIRASEPEDYVTGAPSTTYANNEAIKCVACHVVSRSGKYLAAPTDSSLAKGLFVYDVTLVAPPPPLVEEIADTQGHGFATISPDDTRMVAAWKGQMWMLDRATGAKIGDLNLGMMLKGTHPDWSPNNDQLVFATGDGDAPARASIAVLPYDAQAQTFGAASIVVRAEGDRTNLFPMFSPDGEWIAFSQGKGGHGDNQAQLFLAASSTGAAAAIELVRANRVVSNALGDGQHQNSQPTWAPPGDFAWIAFNSKREYGVVRPKGTQQIWVSAIDLAEARAGRDPSFPAFRLQFQGLDENNHRAFWTQDVRDPPDAGVTPDAGVPPGDGGTPDPASDAGACIGFNQTCDPLSSVCCTGSNCDTQDNGDTYICIPSV